MRLNLIFSALLGLAAYGVRDPEGSSRMVSHWIDQLAHLAHPLLALLPSWPL